MCQQNPSLWFQDFVPRDHQDSFFFSVSDYSYKMQNEELMYPCGVRFMKRGLKSIDREKQRQDGKTWQYISSCICSWGQAARRSFQCCHPFLDSVSQKIPFLALGYVVLQSLRSQITLIVIIVEQMMGLNFGYSQNCWEGWSLDSIWFLQRFCNNI